MHMCTVFPFNINSLSHSHRTFSTQLAVLLSNIIATPRWLSSPPEWITLKPSLLQSSSPGHLVSPMPRTFIPNRAISCFTFSNFPFWSKVLTFQHAIFTWNFFLPTFVVTISLDDDRERLTPFHAERDSTNLWLTVSFTPLSFNPIVPSMSRLGKNKARWFLVVFLVVFDTEFSFSSWSAALSNLIPHHTISYIQP